MTMTTPKQTSKDTRTTPIDNSYPSCDRTCAELRIYPTAISAAAVSSLLGLLPSELGEQGEVRQTSRGTTRTIKKTHWILSSEPCIVSKDLRVHLDWLLDLIEPKVDVLEELASMSGTKISIGCIWWSAMGHGGPTFWPEQLLRLGKLGVEVGFDIQFHDPE